MMTSFEQAAYNPPTHLISNSSLGHTKQAQSCSNRTCLLKEYVFGAHTVMLHSAAPCKETLNLAFCEEVTLVLLRYHICTSPMVIISTASLRVTCTRTRCRGVTDRGHTPRDVDRRRFVLVQVCIFQHQLRVACCTAERGREGKDKTLHNISFHTIRCIFICHYVLYLPAG